jgi:tetratricopeptide (TPR) repeat protein
VDVRQVGKDLNAAYVLEGSLQHQSDRIRISAQLIDAKSGNNLWSEQWERPDKDIFAVQSEISDQVSNRLGGGAGIVQEAGRAAARRKAPSSLDAYELYLLGRGKMIAGLTDASQLEAEKLLEQAIQIDPSLARAHAVLAWTYAWRATLEADTAELTQKMHEEARRAVELDPMDADAQEALGYAYSLSGDLKQAETYFDEALRLNPNGFDILATYACWAHAFGKPEKGADAVDRAMRLNPNYPAWAVDCFRMALVMAGRYEDVLRNQARQPEEKWNQDGYVITAGSLRRLAGSTRPRRWLLAAWRSFPGS